MSGSDSENCVLSGSGMWWEWERDGRGREIRIVRRQF